ncbi:MAG: nitrogen regulation protein NR(II) [Phycisphaerales bacterium]
MGTLFLGLGLGLLAGAFAAVWVLRRHLRRIRSAERRARTAERMAEIGAMTSGLAHEIKNPLSTIGLNAQLLGEGIESLEVEPDEKIRLVNRVKALRRETERLRGILTDFLEFAGQVRLDARPADLNALASELIDFYQPEAERLGVRLRADLAGEPLTASVDQRLFKQALLNLMINGTQAMHTELARQNGVAASDGSGSSSRHAGDLIIRTRARSDEEGQRCAEVHVIDTGPGIAPEIRDRVFTPYFTTKAGGSGLGLPTSRRLIEEHGGRLDLHTEPGRGSDFCIILPLGARHAPGSTGT